MNSEKYDMLADGDTGVPSNMGVVPSDFFTYTTSDSIQESLTGSPDFQLVSFEEDDENTLLAVINYKGEDIPVEIYVNPISRIDIQQFGFANQISEEELDIASRQTLYIEVSMFFGPDILDSFHLQLKILNLLVPHACVVIDFMSYRLLSAQWLRMAVKASVPPSPNYLYTIHGVYDEKDEKKYWLHTHGLLRCKSVEFEILNITESVQQMNDLIVHVVKRILNNSINENEKFQIGYDGMGIHLAWLRWEEALKDFPSDVLGGTADREGEDNPHAEPSGILFAVEDNNLISPQIYAKALSENPIYYISNEETFRMSELAKERFFCFKDAFEKHGFKPEKQSLLKKIFKKSDSEAHPWQFLVKLGLRVDNAKAETEREHLWFNVVSIDGEYIEAELLNQPYWISSLNEGDINKYPADLLTDWMIYSPDNTYTTDSIYELGYFK